MVLFSQTVLTCMFVSLISIYILWSALEAEMDPAHPPPISSTQLHLNSILSLVCIIVCYTCLWFQQTTLQSHIDLFESNFDFCYNQPQGEQYKLIVTITQDTLDCCGKSSFIDYSLTKVRFNASQSFLNFVVSEYNAKCKTSINSSTVSRWTVPESCCNRSSPIICHHLDSVDMMGLYDDNHGQCSSQSVVFPNTNNSASLAYHKGFYEIGCFDAAQQAINKLGSYMESLMLVKVGVESVVFLMMRVVAQSWSSYYDWAYRPSVTAFPFTLMLMLSCAWIGYNCWGTNF